VRLLLAALLGAATAVLGAVVLGDYPLSGSVPWLAAIVIPSLIGAIMVMVADGYETTLWIVTGPLGATSVAWGVRIATGWGLDPVPASAWAAVAVALVWPPCWAAAREWRANRAGKTEEAPGAGSAGDGELRDLRHVGRAEIGDP
jgi:hypothetical protein